MPSNARWRPRCRPISSRSWIDRPTCGGVKLGSGGCTPHEVNSPGFFGLADLPDGPAQGRSRPRWRLGHSPRMLCRAKQASQTARHRCLLWARSARPPSGRQTLASPGRRKASRTPDETLASRPMHERGQSQLTCPPPYETRPRRAQRRLRLVHLHQPEQGPVERHASLATSELGQNDAIG